MKVFPDKEKPMIMTIATFLIRSGRQQTFKINTFSKAEEDTLHDPGKIAHLLRVKISPAYPMLFPLIFLCMFFRPEEDTLFSERFDDARILKRLNIDIRNKD